jgi:D-3-phosphoglycerate dehydrogenase
VHQDDPPLVVVTASTFDLADRQTAGALRSAGLGIRSQVGGTPEADLRLALADAVGAILGAEPIDACTLASCPHLRVIARTGVGVDAIDIDAATSAGVVVTTTPGANDASVAEHTVALMLAAVRRIVPLDSDVRRGAWDAARAEFGGSLGGATVGVIGLGSIGLRVAALVEAFGARVVGHDPFAAGNRVSNLPLAHLLDVSDVVSLHVPLTEATRGMIGATEFASMHRIPILVNTSRGAVIDQAALVDALDRRLIAGAAFDVFEHEPPTGSPLLGRRDVVLSPHVAAFSPNSVAAMNQAAVRSVIDVLSGVCPASAVNPKALRRFTDMHPETGANQHPSPVQ